MKLNPISTKEYPTKAKRPINSRLTKKKIDCTGIERLPHWEDALSRLINDPKAIYSRLVC